MRAPTDEEIVRFAHEVRAVLPELVGEGWEELDAEVARLLAEADAGALDADLLLRALTSAEPVRAWIAARMPGEDTRVRWARGLSGEVGSTATAYAQLVCPASVVAGEEFEIAVGLSAQQQADVVGDAMAVPAEDYTIAIDVIADGLDLCPDSPGRSSCP